MIDPWTLFNAGAWLIFAAWAFAIDRCRDQGG